MHAPRVSEALVTFGEVRRLRREIDVELRPERRQLPTVVGGADDDGAEWLESFSDKHARPFWKNLTTGERTWKRPLGAKVRVHEKKRKRR
mgnify:CR=1 FL=1